MTTGTTNDTFTESPYLTVEEFKDAPTSIDLSNIVVGGNQQAQDAELGRVIMRATSYMNEYLNQNLVATEIIEGQRTRVTPQGWISLHPYNWPIISLSAFAYGTDPLNLYSLPDCSQVWFEGQQIIIPIGNMNWSSQGPLSFGPTATPRAQVFTRYTYVSGFVNTTCVGTAGQSTITVADPTGILSGQHFTIANGGTTENVTVDTTYVYGSTTVPLTSPLLYSHADVSCGNLPRVVKEACILITSAFLKQRGDQALTMVQATRPSGQTQGSQLYGNAIDLALDMVNKYRRVR